MIPPWVEKYVGIPFKDGGQDFDGCDCYQLFRLVYLNEFHIAIPSYAGQYVSAQERAEVSSLIAGHVVEAPWHSVATPRLGDGVLFRIENHPWHCGLVLSPDEFLHVMESLGTSVIERLSSHRWSRRIVGFYRHEALA